MTDVNLENTNISLNATVSSDHYSCSVLLPLRVLSDKTRTNSLSILHQHLSTFQTHQSILNVHFAFSRETTEEKCAYRPTIKNTFVYQIPEGSCVARGFVKERTSAHFTAGRLYANFTLFTASVQTRRPIQTLRVKRPCRVF